MPCLELRVAGRPHPQPVSRLRALLEKPGAAVLRRNQVAEGADDRTGLRNRLRVTAVLAVDLTDPPQEPLPKEAPAAAGEDPGESPQEALPGGFARGMELWFSDGERAVRAIADAEEIPSALALFDAYLRLSRFPPAFERLDQRLVGLHYIFREGLQIGIHGSPAEQPAHADRFFESVAPIAEIDDFREAPFVVRLPDEALVYLHDRLRSAAAWLDTNSYPNILGS